MNKKYGIILKILIVFFGIATGTLAVNARGNDCIVGDDGFVTDVEPEDGYLDECVRKPGSWGENETSNNWAQKDEWKKLKDNTIPKCVYGKNFYMATGGDPADLNVIPTYYNYRLTVESHILYDAGAKGSYLSAIYKDKDNKYFGYEEYNKRIPLMDTNWLKSEYTMGFGKYTYKEDIWPFSKVSINFFKFDQQNKEVSDTGLKPFNDRLTHYVVGNGYEVYYPNYDPFTGEIKNDQYSEAIINIKNNVYGNVFCPSYVVFRKSKNYLYEIDADWIKYANTYSEAVNIYNQAASENNIKYSFEDFYNPRKYNVETIDKNDYYSYIEVLPLIEIEGNYDTKTKRSGDNRKLAWFFADQDEIKAHTDALQNLLDVKWNTRVVAFKNKYEAGYKTDKDGKAYLAPEYQGTNSAGLYDKPINGPLGKCIDAVVGSGENDNLNIDVNKLDNDNVYDTDFVKAVNTMIANLNNRDIRTHENVSHVSYWQLVQAYSNLRKTLEPTVTDEEMYTQLDDDKLQVPICKELISEYTQEQAAKKQECDELIASGAQLTEEQQSLCVAVEEQITKLEDYATAFNNRISQKIKMEVPLPLECDSFGTVIFQIFKYLMILAPILVIVLGSIDFAKATLASNEDALKKAGNSFGKRVIAAVILFLLPTILSLIFNLAYDVGILDRPASDDPLCREKLFGKNQ